MPRDLVQEALWIEDLLDRAGVPTESYEAQGGGMCRWTLAGRVDSTTANFCLVRAGVVLRGHSRPMSASPLEPTAEADFPFPRSQANTDREDGR